MQQPRIEVVSGMAAFVIVTSAYNEALRLPSLIEAVSAQTTLPLRWVLVSDGSTDETDAMAREAARARPWMTFLRRERNRRHDPAARVAPGKTVAIRAALEQVAREPYDYLAVLDADITLPTDYYERVLRIFAEDPRMGIAGGGAYNVYEDGEVSESGFTNPEFVGGPVQMFRRTCYEAIGGYVTYGHEDVLAVAMAKMRGWRVCCDPQIRALHWGQQRPRASEKVPTLYRMGRADYVMHASLWFELMRSVRRMASPPYVAAGLAQLAGYTEALLDRRRKIPASVVLRRYFRREEMAKARSAVRGFMKPLRLEPTSRDPDARG